MDGAQLVELTRLTVRDVAGANGAAVACGDGAGPNREVMMTLLTYCYATRLWASDDIEWATRSRATVRSLGANAMANAGLMRVFRRANRARLEQCLALLLTRAMEERFAERAYGVVCEYRATEPSPEAREWARQKIELAVLMDTAALD